MYEIIKPDELFGELLVRNNPDGTRTFIPFADDNSDYQRYLRWLENPNEEDNGGLN
jgi:hypothetical protein